MLHVFTYASYSALAAVAYFVYRCSLSSPIEICFALGRPELPPHSNIPSQSSNCRQPFWAPASQTLFNTNSDSHSTLSISGQIALQSCSRFMCLINVNNLLLPTGTQKHPTTHNHTNRIIVLEKRIPPMMVRAELRSATFIVTLAVSKDLSS